MLHERSHHVLCLRSLGHVTNNSKKNVSGQVNTFKRVQATSLEATPAYTLECTGQCSSARLTRTLPHPRFLPLRRSERRAASALSGSGWSALQSDASCGPVSSCPPPDAHSFLQAERREKHEATDH